MLPNRRRKNQTLSPVRLMVLAGVLLALLLLGGCKSPAEVHNEHRVTTLIAQAAANGVTQEMFTTAASVPMESVATEGTFGGDFDIPPRQNHLERFPCSNCHIFPAGPLTERGTIPRMSHWEITLQHATPTTLQCTTCHSSDAMMEELQLLDGTTVSFDQSYQVCVQCHSTQGQDWSAGAHGKRLSGWAEPTVRQTCVGCHNPHTPPGPMGEQRWPAIMLTEPKE